MTTRRSGDTSFSLGVFVHGQDGMGVELTESGNGQGERRVVRVWGTPMLSVNPQLLEALKDSGYRPAALDLGSKQPFQLPEAVGVRLGLLLLAVKPLRKLRRIEDVSMAVEALADDEAYYWYAKTNDSRYGRRAQRAFRDLVSDR
ncbi:MAG: hypothetical protein OXI18_05715 [bacterium]|nr:hypothetical protein [bacterium]